MKTHPKKSESPFESIEKVLEGYFDKSLADLPPDKRKRVEKDFPFPGCWDEMSAAQRRSGCKQWDDYHDPALKDRNAIYWDWALVDWSYWQKVLSLTAQEFCILRRVHDPRTFESDQNYIPNDQNENPGDEKKTLGQRVIDDVRIIERSLGLNAQKPIQEWVLWAQQQGWGIPSYLLEFVAQSTPESEGVPRAGETTTHRLGKARTHVLSAVITNAKKSAIDATDLHSVWASLVKTAESKEPPAPLLGHVESEGVKYTTENQQFSIQNLTLQDVEEGNDRHPIRQRIGRLSASFHAQ